MRFVSSGLGAAAGVALSYEAQGLLSLLAPLWLGACVCLIFLLAKGSPVPEGRRIPAVRSAMRAGAGGFSGAMLGGAAALTILEGPLSPAQVAAATMSWGIAIGAGVAAGLHSTPTLIIVSAATALGAVATLEASEFLSRPGLLVACPLVLMAGVAVSDRFQRAPDTGGRAPVTETAAAGGALAVLVVGVSLLMTSRSGTWPISSAAASVSYAAVLALFAALVGRTRHEERTRVRQASSPFTMT